MARSTPMSLWNQLPAERRRHMRWGMAGVAISWSLAAVLAQIGPVSAPRNHHGATGAAMDVMVASARTAANQMTATPTLALKSVKPSH